MFLRERRVSPTEAFLQVGRISKRTVLQYEKILRKTLSPAQPFPPREPHHKYNLFVLFLPQNHANLNPSSLSPKKMVAALQGLRVYDVALISPDLTPTLGLACLALTFFGL